MTDLQAHIAEMQGMASRYLEPAPYVDREGVACRDAPVMNLRDRAFIQDMLYMLDSPEQRQAQGTVDVA